MVEWFSLWYNKDTLANLPLPQRGQPLDYFYISKIVETINSLSKKASVNFTKSKIHVPGGNASSVNTAETMVVAKYQVIANNEAVTATSVKADTIQFGATFKYPPVVTATIQSINQNSASKDAKIVITEVTTSHVKISIDFDRKGTASVGVNVIAVGLPEATT